MTEAHMECPFCLDIIEPKSSREYCCQCSIVVHTDCLNKWSKTPDSCPACKVSAYPSRIIKNFYTCVEYLQQCTYTIDKLTLPTNVSLLNMTNQRVEELKAINNVAQLKPYVNNNLINTFVQLFTDLYITRCTNEDGCKHTFVTVCGIVMMLYKHKLFPNHKFEYLMHYVVQNINNVRASNFVVFLRMMTVINHDFTPLYKIIMDQFSRTRVNRFETQTILLECMGYVLRGKHNLCLTDTPIYQLLCNSSEWMRPSKSITKSITKRTTALIDICRIVCADIKYHHAISTFISTVINAYAKTSHDTLEIQRIIQDIQFILNYVIFKTPQNNHAAFVTSLWNGCKSNITAYVELHAFVLYVIGCNLVVDTPDVIQKIVDATFEPIHQAVRIHAYTQHKYAQKQLNELFVYIRVDHTKFQNEIVHKAIVDNIFGSTEMIVYMDYYVENITNQHHSHYKWLPLQTLMTEKHIDVFVDSWFMYPVIAGNHVYMDSWSEDAVKVSLLRIANWLAIYKSEYMIERIVNVHLRYVIDLASNEKFTENLARIFTVIFMAINETTREMISPHIRLLINSVLSIQKIDKTRFSSYHFIAAIVYKVLWCFPEHTEIVFAHPTFNRILLECIPFYLQSDNMSTCVLLIANILGVVVANPSYCHIVYQNEAYMELCRDVIKLQSHRASINKAILFLFLSGCNFTLTPEQIARFDYIGQYFHTSLYDIARSDVISTKPIIRIFENLTHLINNPERQPPSISWTKVANTLLKIIAEKPEYAEYAQSALQAVYAANPHAFDTHVNAP